MDMTRAHYFLAVVAAGTVTAAAYDLGITQPALSRQLRTLEKELGFKLFDRVGTALVLNDAARAMIPICRRLVSENQRAESAIEGLRAGELEVVRIAATQTTISTLLAPFIAAAGSSIPLISTVLVNHFDALSALEGRADMVISPIPAGPKLSGIPVGTAPIRAWMNQDQVISLGSSEDSIIQLAELLELRLALTSRSSVSRVMLDSLVATAGLQLGTYIECDQTETLIALAHAGQAVAVCTDLQPTGLAGFEIRHQNQPISGVPLTAAWHSGHYAEATIVDIAHRLRSFVSSQLPGGVPS